MDNNVRVAVLGAASFAEVAHIPGVNAHPRAEVVVLYGSDLEHAREMASLCGVPEASDDLEALLARDDIHAVTIVSSDDKHHAYTMAALRAGKHVFCEKPMAINAQDASEMAREAHLRGVVHQMSFTFRHNYGLAGLRERAHAGEIGEPRYIEIHGAWFTRPETREPTVPYQNPAYSRMGYLGEMGSHYIDAVNFIAGPASGFIERNFAAGLAATRVAKAASSVGVATARVGVAEAIIGVAVEICATALPLFEPPHAASRTATIVDAANAPLHIGLAMTASSTWGAEARCTLATILSEPGDR